MGYLLRTDTGYKHLAKKFERAVLTCVERDSSEIAVCLRRFFVRKRFLASENGLYELVSTFCHVAPEDKRLQKNETCNVRTKTTALGLGEMNDYATLVKKNEYRTSEKWSGRAKAPAALEEAKEVP